MYKPGHISCLRHIVGSGRGQATCSLFPLREFVKTFCISFFCFVMCSADSLLPIREAAWLVMTNTITGPFPYDFPCVIPGFVDDHF